MSTALLILLGLAVVLAVAALATRDGAVMAPVEPDRADLELPGHRMTADDLEAVRFGMAPRGYRMAEVDAVLGRLVLELAERERELAELRGAAEDERRAG